MGERGIMGVGGVMVNVGRGRRSCPVLVSAAVAVGPGAGVEGDEEGTMMRRLGLRLFALTGSCAVLCGRTAVSEEDVYCEESCDRWCC